MCAEKEYVETKIDRLIGSIDRLADQFERLMPPEPVESSTGKDGDSLAPRSQTAD